MTSTQRVEVRGDDDEQPDAPPSVVWAVAAGSAPLPFLAVYAVLFITHGTVHPVVPPDIGRTKDGELLAGLVVLALFVAGWLSLAWFVGGTRRWLFALLQAATLATTIGFLADPRSGSPAIPVLLLITSATAVVLAMLPSSARYVGSSGALARGLGRTARGLAGRIGARRRAQGPADETGSQHRA